MSNNSGINRARSAPSRRGENTTSSSNNSSSTGMNQTRPLSSTTIDSKNVNNELHHYNNNIEIANNTNENMNNDSNVDSNYSAINTYNIIDNNAIDSSHLRPRSGRTVASLDESSTSTDVRWLLDTFDNNLITRTDTNGKLIGPNGSIYDASMTIQGDSTSLEFFDRPGSNIQQINANMSLSLLPSTTSQKIISSSQGKRPTTEALSPMIRSLLVSPYTKHRRAKTAANAEKPKSKSSEQFLKFVQPKKPTWSLDPFPSSGLFTEIQKQQESKKEKDKYTSKLVKSWNEETLRVAKHASNVSFQNNDNFQNAINLNVNGNVNVKISNVNMSSANITSSSLPIIDKQIFYSLSETGNENLQSKELFDPSEPDPLYRIMREESERDVDIEKLNELVSQSGPMVANPGARKAAAELAALNPSMMKHNELIELSQFETLPSKVWVIARVVYLLIVNYSELLSDENSNLKIQPPSPSGHSILQSGRKKLKKAKQDGYNEYNDIKNMSDQQYVIWLLSDYELLMEMFWSIVQRQRQDNGINSLNALRKFSWPLLRELFAKHDECAIALFCIEKGGYNLELSVFSSDINERVGSRDFYSIYPEEYIPSLREATRPHAFHPNVVATVSLPAARMCSWARRVVAGIVKIKQASIRYNIENDAPNFECEEDSFTEYKNDRNKSILSQLKISTDSDRQRFEKKIAYPLKKLTQDYSYFNVISMTDGSGSMHAAYLAGMSISRPLDRHDVIIVGKNNPNDLKANYEEMTQLISNSPMHRVMTSSDVLSLGGGNYNDNDDHRVSYAAAVAAARKDIASRNVTDRLMSMDMIDIITHGISHDYDICSIALNTSITTDPKKINELRKLFSSSRFQERSRPFSLLLANRQRSTSLPSLSSISSVSGYTYTPSRYVIFVNNSYESKLTVSMIQAIAKPCDLIFLVYILVQSLKSDSPDNVANGMIEEMNYRSSLLANDLVLQYRANGYNLHVEPIHIPYSRNTMDIKRLQYIATQMRHVASVFEPTYIVLDANDDDIILLANKKIAGKRTYNNMGHSSGNKMMIASSLEEDDENYINIDANHYRDNCNMTLISTMLEMEKQIVLSDRTISFILVLSTSSS